MKLNTNSNSYIIIYSAILVVVVAFLLAFIFQALKPMQDANVALDLKKQILYSLNIRGLDGKQAEEKYAEVVKEEGEVNGQKYYACNIDGEDVLVQSVVHALQHLVVLSILAANREILLDALNAFQSHVLGDLHGVRAPGSDHLAARTDKETLQFLCLFYCGIAVQPTKFVDLVLIELVVYLGSDNALLGSPKKKNHTDILLIFLILTAKVRKLIEE